MGLADFAAVKPNETKRFPGPGQYAMKSCFDSKNGPTIKGRHEPKQPKSTGGGGPIDKDKLPAVPTSIGEGPKYSLYGPHKKSATTTSETSLGPKYRTDQKDMATNPTTPRFSLGRKPAALKAETDRSPGPIYEVKSTIGTRGVTFGGRPNHGAADTVSYGPGPGGYDVPRFGDRVPKPHPQPVHHEVTQKPAEVPGPGEYVVDHYSIAAKTTPRDKGAVTVGTMGGRNFPPDAINSGPGPGAYTDDPESIAARASSKKRGVTILTRYTEYTDMDDIYPRPAPGDYDVPTTFVTKGPGGGKGFSFGSRRPEQKALTKVPGPGEYDMSQYSFADQATRSSKGIKFNADKKFQDGVKVNSARQAKPAEDTGDGSPRTARAPKPPQAASLPDYTRVQPRAPAFTISGRHRTAEPDTTGPGPGSYDMFKYEPKSNGVTFYRGAFAKPFEYNEDPGPGAYDATGSFDKTRSSRAVGFSAHPPTTPRNRTV